jgi:hypothetical protein
MAVPRPPASLGNKGKKFWRDLHKDNTFDAAQTLILEEICRIADRLEGLNDIIDGKGVLQLMHFRVPGTMNEEGLVTVNLTVDGVLSEARQQANVMKQLIVSLRLPEADSGKKPQQRGARGAYNQGSAASSSKPTGAGARVSSLDRARRKAAGEG